MVAEFSVSLLSEPRHPNLLRRLDRRNPRSDKDANVPRNWDKCEPQHQMSITGFSRAWLKIDMQVSLFTCQKGLSDQIRFPSPSFHSVAELSTICNRKSWLQCCYRVQISMCPFNHILIPRSPGFHRMYMIWGYM